MFSNDCCDIKTFFPGRSAPKALNYSFRAMILNRYNVRKVRLKQHFHGIGRALQCETETRI